MAMCDCYGGYTTSAQDQKTRYFCITLSRTVKDPSFSFTILSFQCFQRTGLGFLSQVGFPSLNQPFSTTAEICINRYEWRTFKPKSLQHRLFWIKPLNSFSCSTKACAGAPHLDFQDVIYRHYPPDRYRNKTSRHLISHRLILPTS